MPALSALVRMVPEPEATRSISKLSDGMVAPCASMIIGTRRTMPSRSFLIVNRPRPAAACLQHRDVAQQARKIEQELLRLLAAHRKPRHRQRFVEFAEHIGKAGLAQHHARALEGIGQNLIVARQRAQLGPGFLVEIAGWCRPQRPD